MSIHPLLDRISLTVSACTAEHGQDLANARAPLQELCQVLAAGNPRLGLEQAHNALNIINQILDGHSTDPAGDFANLTKQICDLVEALDAVPQQSQPENVQPSCLDMELLEMFLRSCDESLSNIESLLLDMDASGENPEGLASLRRLVHTIKGECGVIPLPVAQRLLHEAESMIDRYGVANRCCKTDALFQVVDWLKGYLRLLAAEANAIPPPADALLSLLRSLPGADTDSTHDAQARVTFADEVFQDPTLTEFVAETRAHLEDAEAALLAVEEKPDHIESIDRIFRTFHTIKGVASFLQMAAMAGLAHKTEALLDEFRKGRLRCQHEHITLLFEACDLMASMVNYLTGDEAPLLSTVEDLSRRLVIAANQPPVSSSPAPASPTPRAQPPASGSQLTHQPADKAQAATAKSHKQPPTVELGTSAPASLQPNLPQSRPTPAAAASAPAADAREPIPRKTSSIDNTVKVATERLDALVDMVGELVIAQQMIHQDPEIVGIKSQVLQRNLSQVAKITRTLQESSMSLRMVTLKSTFQKMSRLARDVSQKSNKLVTFVTEGEDTELDRNVVEEISDPLVHLIRNAIDHGIEPPEERLSLQKSERGTVCLKSYHQGGSIVIEICDDGRGLSRKKIIAKAIERGLIADNSAHADLPDSEVFRMIFLPGFSTAEKVTDISGRGVGMDVVRRNIEAMRGKIEIQSVLGKGSQFILRLPLTLAIIDGMIVRVGETRYVVPTLAVEQSFRPTPAQLHSIYERNEMVLVRGALLPIIRLDELFGTDTQHCAANDSILIVVETDGRRACLLVDELLAQQQVVIKSLGKALPPLRGISGGAILGNGRVALILDIDAVLMHATKVTT